eukprot:COSAG02_NODE_493_length_21166_cov_13.181318_9_plen_62_part_00
MILSIENSATVARPDCCSPLAPAVAPDQFSRASTDVAAVVLPPPSAKLLPSSSGAPKVAAC